MRSVRPVWCIDENRIRGRAEFTRDIPAGPVVLYPNSDPDAQCEENIPVDKVVIKWEPVTESIYGDPLTIVRYEVIVETDDPGDLNFDVKFPAESGTELTVPAVLLQPDTALPMKRCDLCALCESWFFISRPRCSSSQGAQRICFSSSPCYRCQPISNCGKSS